MITFWHVNNMSFEFNYVRCIRMTFWWVFRGFFFLQKFSLSENVNIIPKGFQEGKHFCFIFIFQTISFRRSCCWSKGHREQTLCSFDWMLWAKFLHSHCLSIIFPFCNGSLRHLCVRTNSKSIIISWIWMDSTSDFVDLFFSPLILINFSHIVFFRYDEFYFILINFFAFSLQIAVFGYSTTACNNQSPWKIIAEGRERTIKAKFLHRYCSL